jgi:hypothetical protein
MATYAKSSENATKTLSKYAVPNKGNKWRECYNKIKSISDNL